MALYEHGDAKTKKLNSINGVVDGVNKELISFSTIIDGVEKELLPGDPLSGVTYATLRFTSMDYSEHNGSAWSSWTSVSSSNIDSIKDRIEVFFSKDVDNDKSYTLVIVTPNFEEQSHIRIRFTVRLIVFFANTNTGKFLDTIPSTNLLKARTNIAIQRSLSIKYVHTLPASGNRLATSTSVFGSDDRDVLGDGDDFTLPLEVSGIYMTKIFDYQGPGKGAADGVSNYAYTLFIYSGAYPPVYTTTAAPNYRKNTSVNNVVKLSLLDKSLYVGDYPVPVFFDVLSSNSAYPLFKTMRRKPEKVTSVEYRLRCATSEVASNNTDYSFKSYSDINNNAQFECGAYENGVAMVINRLAGVKQSLTMSWEAYYIFEDGTEAPAFYLDYSFNKHFFADIEWYIASDYPYIVSDTSSPIILRYSVDRPDDPRLTINDSVRPQQVGSHRVTIRGRVDPYPLCVLSNIPESMGSLGLLISNAYDAYTNNYFNSTIRGNVIYNNGEKTIPIIFTDPK